MREQPAPQLNLTDRAFHAAVSRIAEAIAASPPEDWAKARPLARSHGASHRQAVAVEARLARDRRLETTQSGDIVYVRGPLTTNTHTATSTRPANPAAGRGRNRSR